jgi:hypothetical protein
MFDRTLRRIATLVVALTGLAACDTSPVAPRIAPSARVASSVSTPSGNVVSTATATVPFVFGVYASCANAGQGEVLDIVGTLQYTGHWITTSGGQRQHNATISRFTGTATGWDSGDVYDATERDLYQTNTNYGTDGIPDSGEELQRVRVRLTNRASGATVDLTIVGRFVQTATGEYVLSGWDGTARCS